MNRLVGITVCLFLAASMVRPIADTDLGWHIAAGRWALAHGSLPKVDHWNAFSGGKPWVPYSWSNEIFFAAAEQHFGWAGLLSVSLLFAIILVAAITWTFTWIAADGIMGILLSMIAIAGFQDYFDLRPQSLTWGFFALAVCCGYRAATTSGNHVYAAFAALCCFWANTHLTTLFGIICSGAWVLALGQPRNAVKLMLAGFLGSLLTPHFGAEWLIMLGKADHPFLYSIVSEFQPASIWYPSAAVSLLVFVLLAMLRSEMPRRIPSGVFLLAAAFTLLGFAVQKFVPYATVLSCCSLALFWRSREILGKKEAPLSFSLTRLRDAAAFISRRGGLAIAVLSLVIAFSHYAQVLRHPIDRLALPVAALDYVRTNQLPGPILNDFSDGGYILYRFLAPDGNPLRRVPLDGRTNVNDPEIMAAFVDTIFGNSHWMKYFERVRPNLVVWRNRYALPAMLRATGDWCSLYSDETVKAPMRGWSVFVRRGAHPLCAMRDSAAS